ncbi:MAG: ATP-binding protein [Rhodospirillaceae bacterium]|nr:ATP-binding protein [Rhodospirillaceae bacterium]
MSSELRLALPVRLSALRDLSGKVEAFGETNRLPAQKVFVINLALDELITNAVTHGSFEHTSDPKIEIYLRVNEDVLLLTMEDNGAMFDPTLDTVPDLESSLEVRTVGGLGLHLVKTFADRVAYEFVGGRNRLTLEHDLKPH